MNFSEMKAKTGLQVVGIVDMIDSYVSKKNNKTYYSLDLIISGLKEKLNVRLPEGYDLSKVKDGELMKTNLTIDRFGNWQAILPA